MIIGILENRSAVVFETLVCVLQCLEWLLGGELELLIIGLRLIKQEGWIIWIDLNSRKSRINHVNAYVLTKLTTLSIIYNIWLINM